MKKHIIIIGERQVGKSTLVRKLMAWLETQGVSTCGVITQGSELRENGMRYIYLYDLASPEREQTEDYWVAEVGKGKKTVNRDGFAVRAVSYLDKATAEDVVILDELGFIETEIEEFTSKIMQLLNGDIPTIIVTKKVARSSFVDELKQCETANIFYIDEENRDELFEEVRSVLEEILRNR